MSRLAKITLLAVGLVVVIGAVAAPAVFAQTGPNSQLVNLSFPCPSGFKCTQFSSSTNIGDFINSFYQIALGIAGLLALLMVVVGGVKYTISAGNTSQQEDAKDIITSALYGVGLLLASYLILNTVNPKLTTLTLPGSEPQFGQVATSSPNVSVPNTECIPLNSSTEDPNNTSTLSATAGYNNLLHPQTYDGDSKASYQGFRSGSQENCSYRTAYANATIGVVNDGSYYNENTNIPGGSEIWQYPYFPGSATSSADISSQARCLIYAYQRPGDSSPTMISLNSGLQLCYPHSQTIGNVSSSAAAYCNPNFPCACSSNRCSPLSALNGDPPYKGPGIACNGNTCYLDNNLITKLQAVYAQTQGWQVSEAWPPTVTHSSLCHNVGTCADIVLSPQMTQSTLDCKAVTSLVAAFKNQGLTVINEYPSQCGGTTYDTTTGWNIHVEDTKIITGGNY